MAINVSNFLLSLAYAMSQNVAPATPAVTLGTNLFVNQAVEALVTSLTDGGGKGSYAVLRPYGGPPPTEGFYRIDCLSLQLAASSKDAAAAQSFAWQLYESLHWDDGSGNDGNGKSSKPRYSWLIDPKTLDPVTGALIADTSIANWEVCLIVFAQPPGLVGRDERGMWQCSFNVDARFAAVPLAQ